MRILSKFRGYGTHDRDSAIVGNLGNIERKISESQTKLKEATKLLDRGTVEYGRLYRSRFNLLTRVAELLVRYENMGQMRIARDLENILLDEGVERFEPKVGEPILRGKYKVNKMEFNGISPGLVALVSAPGFLGADGEVILPAEVFESILPTESETERIIVRQISGGTGTKWENYLDVLLLCSDEQEYK